MSKEQSLRNGAALMILGALIFLIYAVVFFFGAFTGGGFEIGIATINGVTEQQLNDLNPAIMPSPADHRSQAQREAREDQG